jgi:hypothetical protein
MKNKTLAKVFGYVGAAALTLGQAGTFGKWSGLVLSAGSVLSAFGIHQASNSDGK